VGAGRQVQWGLDTPNKGEKERTVPVSGELLQALRRCRLAHGLIPPGRRHRRDTARPAVQGPAAGPVAPDLHDALKAIFAGAWLRLSEPEFGDRSDELERGPGHRLRHRTGSHQADGDVDPRTIRDNLRHASLVDVGFPMTVVIPFVAGLLVTCFHCLLVLSHDVSAKVMHRKSG
jgi:integrase